MDKCLNFLGIERANGEVVFKKMGDWGTNAMERFPWP